MILDRIRNLFSRPSMVRLEGEPAQRGSLIDQIIGFSNEYNIFPSYRFEFLNILSWLVDFHQDMSQTVRKIISLGNVGHSLEIEGSERAVESALDELNYLARNAFPNNAGADGFINQQFRQIMVTGALCQETVPSQGLSEVSDIYQVKTSTIRFKFDKIEGFVPYQELGSRQILLNTETFSYIPLFTGEDNPYAIPPFLAALRWIMRQSRQWEGIDDFTEQLGILGFMHMTANLRMRIGETEKDFQERAKKELQRYYDMYLSHRKKGIAVTAENIKLEMKTISKNLGQMDKILEATHQGITSGLNIDPAMLGYTYSTTETYAGMVYKTLLNEISNIQRIIKRTNERPYNMHLTLRRIPAVCSIRFKQSQSLNEKEDAEAKKINQDMVIERKNEGIIGPDDAARELGYDEAYTKDDRKTEAGLGRFEFQFNKTSDRYEFSRPIIRVLLSKKKETIETLSG